MTFVSFNKDIRCFSPCHEDIVKCGQCHCNNCIKNESYDIEDELDTNILSFLDKLKNKDKEE